MQRVAFAPVSARSSLLNHSWLARRWYITPTTRRTYSVRQVSPGDRRMLAEFVLALGAPAAGDRSHTTLSSLLFDRVIVTGNRSAVGFAALESRQNGDRVVGACAYAPLSDEGADFAIAVVNSFRDEQVGHTLLATLVRQAKRVGVRRLTGTMAWSNRAMQSLAMSMGFAVEPLSGDRTKRRLELALR